MLVVVKLHFPTTRGYDRTALSRGKGASEGAVESFVDLFLSHRNIHHVFALKKGFVAKSAHTFPCSDAATRGHSKVSHISNELIAMSCCS